MSAMDYRHSKVVQLVAAAPGWRVAWMHTERAAPGEFDCFEDDCQHVAAWALVLRWTSNRVHSAGRMGVCVI
jgi:hypothetical protein